MTPRPPRVTLSPFFYRFSYIRASLPLIVMAIKMTMTNSGENEKGKDKVSDKDLPAGLEMKMEATKKTREAASQR